MNTTTEEQLVVNYDPSHYVALDAFRKQWAVTKAQLGNIATDPYALNPNASSSQAGLHVLAPLLLLFSMFIVSVSVSNVRNTNPEAALWDYFSFTTIFGLVGLVMSLNAIRKKTRFAVRLKRDADLALLESARRYLRKRYGFLPVNWETRFISYLLGEEVNDDRFSENYQLVVRNVKGYKVVMVSNLHGEAPVKYKG